MVLRTRAALEPRFGHDFGKVRVHADEQAARSARQVNAVAYTVGPHVVLDKGKYGADTPSGLRLMAHELAHVVQQQNAGGVPQTVEIGAPGDASEVEADRAADAALARRPPSEIKAAGRAPLLRRQPASGSGKPVATPEVPGEPRVIASFDVSPGNKRPWNLNQLTKDIVTALSASDLAYVTVLGAYPTKANEDDPQGHPNHRASRTQPPGQRTPARRH